jgi:hypothetical protein
MVMSYPVSAMNHAPDVPKFSGGARQTVQKHDTAACGRHVQVVQIGAEVDDIPAKRLWQPVTYSATRRGLG